MNRSFKTSIPGLSAFERRKLRRGLVLSPTYEVRKKSALYRDITSTCDSRLPHTGDKPKLK